VLPSATTITSISVSFVTTVAYASTSSELTAQVWVSTPSSDTYTPLAGASASLALSSSGVGTVFNGSTTGLNIAIPAGDRAVVAFSLTGPIEINLTTTGNGTAGITYTS
jgi:hypothetical protein